jgi:hypothetical protein
MLKTRAMKQAQSVAAVAVGDEAADAVATARMKQRIQQTHLKSSMPVR